MIVKRHLLGENFLLPKYKQILRVFVYKPPKKRNKGYFNVSVAMGQWEYSVQDTDDAPNFTKCLTNKLLVRFYPYFRMKSFL